MDSVTQNEAASSLTGNQENGSSGSANGNGNGMNGPNGAGSANGKAGPASGNGSRLNGQQPSPVLQQRVDSDFRNVLGSGLAACRRNILTAGIFSFFVNVLLLAMPIYLFQLSDRVYTSRSTDTLIMLSLVVGGAIVAHVFLDMMRRFILMRVAIETEAKLGRPFLARPPGHRRMAQAANFSCSVTFSTCAISSPGL